MHGSHSLEAPPAPLRRQDLSLRSASNRGPSDRNDERAPVVCRYLARLSQLFEIVQVSIDTVRDGAAKAGGQLQGHTRALVRKRRERNDSRGEMIRSAVVGKGSPGQSSLRNAQHHLKCRVMPLSVKTKRRDKMVVVQFSHAFDRGDEFWIILKRQPALVDIGNCRVDHDRSLRGVHRQRSGPLLWHLFVRRRNARIHISKTRGSSRR